MYAGADYLERALQPARTRSVVVVLSGNNARKGEYITRFIDAGMNVLADKPMVIRPQDLHGDGPVEVTVDRGAHRAHTAVTEDRSELVASREHLRLGGTVLVHPNSLPGRRVRES